MPAHYYYPWLSCCSTFHTILDYLTKNYFLRDPRLLSNSGDLPNILSLRFCSANEVDAKIENFSTGVRCRAGEGGNIQPSWVFSRKATFSNILGNDRLATTMEKQDQRRSTHFNLLKILTSQVTEQVEIMRLLIVRERELQSLWESTQSTGFFLACAFLFERLLTSQEKGVTCL